MKVYTKNGDGGRTQLFTGEMRPKSNVLLSVLGDIDQVNCQVGVALIHVDNEDVVNELTFIQSRLFDLGACVATPRTGSKHKVARASFDPCHVERLEAAIDRMDATLPPLTTFILPGGGAAAAHLHLARAFARQAERTFWALAHSEADNDAVDQNVGVYLNRLSDYFFVAARFMSNEQGRAEAKWEKWVKPADAVGVEPSSTGAEQPSA